MYEILILGKGWGADSLINGLHNNNSINIEVVSDNIELHINPHMSNTYKRIDLIICSGYVKKIPDFIIDKYNVINIHYSLLPSYRGLHSVVWAILNNEKKIGLTIHKVNNHFDDGDILYQHAVENESIKTSYDFITSFNKHIETIISSFIIDYLNNKIKPIKQNKENASWVPKRNINDCKVDFNTPINELKLFFRALVEPYPLPYFFIRNEKYLVKEIFFKSCNIKSINGIIVNIDEYGMWITSNGGYLVIKEVINEAGEMIANFNNFNIGYRIK